MNKKTKLIKNLSIVMLLASLSGLLPSGCASITRGTQEVLVINSDPAGAAVCLSNGLSGTTPTSFKLPRNSVLSVVIEKPGYKTATVTVNNQISTDGKMGMLGNVIFGGFIGMGIDVASGATQDLTPNPVFVTLEPLSCQQELASNF